VRERRMMEPNQEAQQAVPYKTDQQPPDTKYEVEENGDVKITQVVTTVSFWKYREYLTLMRQNDKALEDTKYNTSAEFTEKMKEQEKKIQAEIDLMNPVMSEAEELTKKDYEKQRHEGLKKNLLESIEAKETPYPWFTNIWAKVKQEVKDPIFKELSATEQSKLLKIMARLKRKGA